MEIIDAIEPPTAFRAGQQNSLGFVPTMGALHAGHIALVQRARAENEQVAVSIFINPLQFSAGEDLERYPRQFEQDCALLEDAGVDWLFAPDAVALYPQGFDSSLHIGGLGQGLCDAMRPGHFDGVCTVVAKLFHLIQPHRAYFGEKDYQQLCMIQKMVRDLNFPLEICPVATYREPDGLAMSSRNQYLDAKERQVAPRLYQRLGEAASSLSQGESAQVILPRVAAQLVQDGFDSVDYLSLRDAASLQPLGYVGGTPCRLLAAARLGTTRLIDNIEVIAHG